MAVGFDCQYGYYVRAPDSFSNRTDQAGLTWLLRLKNPEGQLARWISVEELSQYNVILERRYGARQGNADASSLDGIPVSREYYKAL